MEKLYMIRVNGKWDETAHPQIDPKYVPAPVVFQPKLNAGLKLPLSIEGTKFAELWQKVGPVKNPEQDIRVVPKYINSFLLYKLPDTVYDEHDQAVRKSSYQRRVVTHMTESAHLPRTPHAIFLCSARCAHGHPSEVY